ncbi:UdgX family uracil-DNA binding protein [Streptomyces sp. NPDC058653]|uniref:UdgX family uracil-DNA binding protein n=1 Tax=Streptomyces sp. NPDC058653 TaxID=3346576 RepID=UPI003651A4CC
MTSTSGSDGNGELRGAGRSDAERSDAERYDAEPFLPGRGGLPAHRRAAADCHGCPLYEEATGTVFGSGTSAARLMLVGEEPGDQEDRQGEPFVGPAGHLLRRALREVGLDEEPAYLTNAVKHFKFTRFEHGRRRIHKPPSLREMTACRPWLDAELRLVRPEMVVALGAIAVRSLLGPTFRVTKDRGSTVPLPPPPGTERKDAEQARVLITLHPSAVLRSDDREAAYAGFLADLRVAADALH